MNESVQIIPLANLALILIPVIFVLIIYFKWSLGIWEANYSLARMLLQLTIIGYLLGIIFSSTNGILLFSICGVMLLASTWIALRTVKRLRVSLFAYTMLSILIGSVSVLLLILTCVLNLDPWYEPRYLIPLAGMIFANAMNCVSLAIDRLVADYTDDADYDSVKNAAFQAAMIPVINSLFAVGLVTLPGMMTGQILSGVDPLIAARYQIMVMCMIFSSAGLTTASFLILVKKPIISAKKMKA